MIRKYSFLYLEEGFINSTLKAAGEKGFTTAAGKALTKRSTAKEIMGFARKHYTDQRVLQGLENELARRTVGRKVGQEVATKYAAMGGKPAATAARNAVVTDVLTSKTLSNGKPNTLLTQATQLKNTKTQALKTQAAEARAKMDAGSRMMNDSINAKAEIRQAQAEQQKAIAGDTTLNARQKARRKAVVAQRANKDVKAQYLGKDPTNGSEYGNDLRLQNQMRQQRLAQQRAAQEEARRRAAEEARRRAAEEAKKNSLWGKTKKYTKNTLGAVGNAAGTVGKVAGYTALGVGGTAYLATQPDK